MLVHLTFKKIVRFWTTKSLLACLKCDQIIIFIETMSHGLSVQILYLTNTPCQLSFAFTDLDKAGASSYLWLEPKGEIPRTTEASIFRYVPETRYENLVTDPLSKMLNCGILWMTLKTPICLFPVMLNISVESRELPRPQSHAITFWGTKEVIVESFRSVFTASL